MKKDILSALDIALRETADDGPPRDGEFTVYDYIDARIKEGRPITRFHGRELLEKMVVDGKLSKRYGKYNGTRAAIYSKGNK